MIGSHANARIGYAEREPIPVPLRASDLQADRAALGELTGIGQKIEETLPDLGEVSAHGADVRAAVDFEMVGVLLGKWLDRGHHVADHGWHIERLQYQLQLSGFDFGEIEDIVDKGE